MKSAKDAMCMWRAANNEVNRSGCSVRDSVNTPAKWYWPHPHEPMRRSAQKLIRRLKR